MPLEQFVLLFCVAEFLECCQTAINFGLNLLFHGDGFIPLCVSLDCLFERSDFVPHQLVFVVDLVDLSRNRAKSVTVLFGNLMECPVLVLPLALVPLFQSGDCLHQFVLLHQHIFYYLLQIPFIQALLQQLLVPLLVHHSGLFKFEIIRQSHHSLLLDTQFPLQLPSLLFLLCLLSQQCLLEHAYLHLQPTEHFTFNIILLTYALQTSHHSLFVLADLRIALAERFILSFQKIGMLEQLLSLLCFTLDHFVQDGELFTDVEKVLFAVTQFDFLMPCELQLLTGSGNVVFQHVPLGIELVDDGSIFLRLSACHIRTILLCKEGILQCAHLAYH